MTQISFLESKADNLESKIQHSDALIRALGDPSQWQWTGDIYDAGAPVASCACGHQIRYIYPIINSQGLTNQVGSTCIYYFQEVNPEMAEKMRSALVELEEKIKQAKADSKKQEQDEEVKKLEVRFNKLISVAKEYKEWYKSKGKFCPKDLYAVATYYRWDWGGVEKNPPQYKRVNDYIKWYSQRIDRLEAITSYYQVEVEEAEKDN